MSACLDFYIALSSRWTIKRGYIVWNGNIMKRQNDVPQVRKSALQPNGQCEYLPNFFATIRRGKKMIFKLSKAGLNSVFFFLIDWLSYQGERIHVGMQFANSQKENRLVHAFPKGIRIK